jgi:hypothetical protein
MARLQDHAPGEPCCGACGVAADVERTGRPLVADRGEALDGSSGCVEVTTSDGASATLLGKARFIIGRGRHCDLVINSGKVSREQAVLEFRDGQVEIVDQGSGCGTFVNGVRVNRSVLHQNDVVLIADLSLRFRG